MTASIRSQLRELSRQVQLCQPVLRFLVRTAARRAAEAEEQAVAKALGAYLQELPGFDPKKEAAAVLAFGKALQVPKFWGSKHAPAHIQELETTGSIEGADPGLKLKIVFRVGLRDPLNRAITIASSGANTLAAGDPGDPKLATAVARWLAGQAKLDLTPRSYFHTLIQRDPQVVQSLRAEFGTAQMRITGMPEFSTDPSGGLFGIEAMVAVRAKLELATA